MVDVFEQQPGQVMSAREHVTVSLMLMAPVDAVWSLIAGGDRVERWFEWVEETIVRDPAEGGLRVIRMKDGTAFDEYITLNDLRSHTYQYYAPNPPLPIQHVIGTKRIELGVGGCPTLTWFVSFVRESSAPPGIAANMRTLYAAALARIDEIALRAR